MLEADAVPGVGPAHRSAARGGDRSIQEIIERREVEVVLVHAAHGREYRSHRGLPLAEQHQVHGHAADGDAAAHGRDGDPGVRGIQRRGGEQAQGEAPAVAADRERAILVIKAREDVAVAREEARAEAVEAHFLGVILARQHGLEIHLHARFRRAPAKQAEGIAGELGLGDECRHAGEQQHDDGPGREMDQQHAKTQQRDGVLQQAKGAHHQAQRPARSLAPRAGELVVELRVFEMRKVERQGLLENHHVDTLAELRAQQRLAQRQAALHGCQQGHQHAFEQHQPQHGPELVARGMAGGHHGIDDLRPDPGHGGRQQAAGDGQRRGRTQQRPVGVPDQAHGMPAVAEHAEEAAQHGQGAALGRSFGRMRRTITCCHQARSAAGRCPGAANCGPLRNRSATTTARRPQSRRRAGSSASSADRSVRVQPIRAPAAGIR